MAMSILFASKLPLTIAMTFRLSSVLRLLCLKRIKARTSLRVTLSPTSSKATCKRLEKLIVDSSFFCTVRYKALSNFS